ncbi:MAG: MerR family transcriptional regulator [bacterium]|nr:MerR family transcriptional regulator [bacterium]
MDYRVEELASQAGIRVDTVRYYQGKGLLPAPRREGRVAWYGDAHLERLTRIRELRDQGLTLSLIGRVFSQESDDPGGSLVEALVEEHLTGRSYTKAELAAQAGVPEAFVTAAQTAGLIEPLLLEAEERFSEADLSMARAGLELLEAGFPMQELLRLAVRHASHVQETTEAAIDLFDGHVRRDAAGEERDPADVTQQFRTLLPVLTRLVAQHFQRTLVSRALGKVADQGSSEELRDALAATESGLEVSVSWR